MDTEDNTEYIIGIVIIGIIVLFIVAIIIGYYLSKRNNNGTPQSITTIGTLLSPCTTTSCQDGLICDGTVFLCKLPVNSICTDASDCVTGLICSGLCATGPTGGLNSLCPCNPGFICTSQTNSLTICKGGTGISCVNNSDCASDICSNGICTGGLPNSAICTNNTECGSRNCNNGFCQPFGTISGVLGAACAGSCVSFTGAQCISSNTQPLSCSCLNGQGEPGTCVAATQGIISVCSTNTLCSDELVCFNQQGTNCTSGNTGCICLFPYDDPNVIQVDNICISGMSERNSSCFNNNGLGCDNGSLCFNNSCSGDSVLAVYKFSTKNIQNLRTNFINTTSTNISPLTGPTGNIMPYKMFSTSDLDVDTIYLVDTIQGFLFARFNPINNIVVTPWQILIPKITVTATTTRTLIDVCFNGTNFLTAFNEVVNNTQQRNNTVYIGLPGQTLTPFNITSGSGIPGTQYNTNNIALSINYIDISRPNQTAAGDDVLISINGTIYIKQATQTLYSIGIIVGGPSNGQPMVNTIGVSRFYFDITRNITKLPITLGNSNNSSGVNLLNEAILPVMSPSYDNVSFVKTFNPGTGGIFEQVLQFSGNVAGVALPTDRFNNVQYKVFDYDIYSTEPTGMINSGIIMLASAFRDNLFIEDVVAISYGGNTTIIPYRISKTCRCVVSNNAFYILSIGSCT